MIEINWYGNNGYNFPLPGTVRTAKCGVCGARMHVKRNVLGTTSYAEAVAGRKHRHDSFRCPRVGKDWHKRIYKLKIDVYLAEIRKAADYEEKKRAAEKEILRILKEHVT